MRNKRQAWRVTTAATATVWDMGHGTWGLGYEGRLGTGDGGHGCELWATGTGVTGHEGGGNREQGTGNRAMGLVRAGCGIVRRYGPAAVHVQRTSCCCCMLAAVISNGSGMDVRWRKSGRCVTLPYNPMPSSCMR